MNIGLSAMPVGVVRWLAPIVLLIRGAYCLIKTGFPKPIFCRDFICVAASPTTR